MTWFKVDDGLAFHAKVVQAGNSAMGLWVRAGSWCAQQLTEGFVPDHMVTTLGTRNQAKALEDAELWLRDGNGYRFHGWLDYNPTAEEVRADQARKHEAKVNAGRAGGLASGVARRKHTRSRDEANAKQNGSKTKPRPVPSRPDHLDSSVEGASHVSSGSASEPPLYPDRCSKHGNTYEPGNCGGCADARKAVLRFASVGPHNPATKPHCGECDETRMLRTRFGAIPCPNCNPAAEEASA